jgi:hypothetical protein
MPYLQCPECKLTVPAKAYYLRGDECPRCLTTMEPCDRFSRADAPHPAIASGKRTSRSAATAE